MFSIIRVAARVAAICALVTASSIAGAQATRTWVSGVGDDANPCSRTAPCKTFAGAISKTAASGEINVLDPGGFGAVTITKSITIDGGGFIAGVLVSGTNGIVVSVADTDRVVLRNLDINGLNTGLSGIRMLSAGNLIVENSTIYGFTVAGISIANTAGNVRAFVDGGRISANDTGISVAPTSPGTATLHVSNATITQNTTGLSTGAGGSIISFNNNRIIANTTDGNPSQTIYTR